MNSANAERQAHRAAVLVLLAALCAAIAACPRTRSIKASTLRVPEVDEKEYIEGTRWEPHEGTAGFDVVAEFEPLAIDQDGSPRSGYLGRVGETFYFRSAAGELLAAPMLKAARSVVARGVPEGTLVTGDERAVYWITPSCEVFTPPAQHLGSCVGRPDAVASSAEFVYAVTSVSGAPTTRVWRIPKRGGLFERFADIDGYARIEQVLLDDDHLYFTNPGTLFRLPRAGGKAAPFARESPGYHIETLQFVDKGSLFWTDREDGGRDETRLLRAGEDGGPPRILGSADGVVAADARSFYWFEPTFSSLYRAPRAGGHWEHLAVLPRGGFELFPRAGGVLAMDGTSLLWIPDHARRPRRLHERTTALAYLTDGGDNLYFVAWMFDGERNGPDTGLWSVPKAGGDPRLILRGEFWSAPVIDGVFAYFRGAQGKLERAPLDGGAPRTLVDEARLASFPRNPDSRGLDGSESSSRRVALDEADVFFAEPERGLVLRVRKTGGAPSVIARLSDAPRALTVDAANVYVGTESVGPTAANTLPRLLRVAKSGKEPPVVLAALDGDPATELAVTASHVFWSDGSAAFRIPKIGGVVEKIQEQACDFVIREDALFFVTCGAPGGVWRLRLSDRKLSALATSLTSPRHVVADDRAIHWLTTGTDINPKSSDLVGCCSVWALER